MNPLSTPAMGCARPRPPRQRPPSSCSRPGRSPVPWASASATSSSSSTTEACGRSGWAGCDESVRMICVTGLSANEPSTSPYAPRHTADPPRDRASARRGLERPPGSAPKPLPCPWRPESDAAGRRGSPAVRMHPRAERTAAHATGVGPTSHRWRQAPRSTMRRPLSNGATWWRGSLPRPETADSRSQLTARSPPAITA